MNWRKVVVKLNVKSKDIDYAHPLNIYGSDSYTGTGFFISNDTILTCYHVVENAINIEIIFNQTINIQGKIKHIFPDDDLAIIQLEYPLDNDSITILELKNIIKTNDEQVMVVGFPLDSTNVKITKGIISGYQESLIQTDASLNSGNSGGPMVVEEDGNYKIIGVNVSKITGDVDRVGYVVPIYRFMILQKKLLTKEIVIKKPLLFLDYQYLVQQELRKYLFKHCEYNLINKNIGVRFTLINENYYLNKYFKIDEILIAINSTFVDNLGNIKFDFYPEKISINDIGLWFVEDDELDFLIYNPIYRKFRNVKIKLEIIKNNLTDYFNFDTYPKSIINNNGLILSIVTKEHINNIKYLNMTTSQAVKILSRYLQQQDQFTIYLADLDLERVKNKFIKYPLGEIIIEINGKKFNNLEEFMKINENPIKIIKTFDNEIYLI